MHKILASNYCRSVFDGTHDSPKYLKSGKHLVTSKFIGNGLDLDSSPYISKEDFDLINMRSKVEQWDVLFSMIGTVGNSYLIKGKPDFAIKNIGAFRARNELDAKYLYYYFQSSDFKKTVQMNLVGSTQKFLGLNQLRNLEIFVPETEEIKRHIVGTIGTIDDLIEKEQELLMKIESFEKKLFSAAFEQERKNHYRLSEVCDFVPGYSYTSDELVDSPMGMVTIKSVDRAGGFKAEGIKSLLPESSLKSEKMCQVGDVLVAHTDLTKNQEIIGSPIIVATTGGFHSLTFSMDMVKVEPKNHLFSRPLIYQILKSQSFKAHALGYCNGSTVIHLSKGALANYEFDGPMASDIVDINGKLSDTYKVKISIVNKLENLAESKRILLERYF